MNKFMRKLEKKFSRLDDSTKKTIIIIGCILISTLIIVLSFAQRSTDNFKNN